MFGKDDCKKKEWLIGRKEKKSKSGGNPINWDHVLVSTQFWAKIEKLSLKNASSQLWLLIIVEITFLSINFIILYIFAGHKSKKHIFFFSSHSHHFLFSFLLCFQTYRSETFSFPFHYHFPSFALLFSFSSPTAAKHNVRNRTVFNERSKFRSEIENFEEM